MVMVLVNGLGGCFLGPKSEVVTLIDNADHHRDRAKIPQDWGYWKHT